MRLEQVDAPVAKDMAMVLSRSDFATFTRTRDAWLKNHEAASAAEVGQWKRALLRDLVELPYLESARLVEPKGRRQQIAVMCKARFMKLNLSIAQSDMEKIVAAHCGSGRDVCYTVGRQGDSFELHFAELTAGGFVLSGVVTIVGATSW
jgi:hypothetical protein